MRTALGLVSLMVLMLASASGGPVVSCDGRKAKECQCDDGKVPAGYYQAAQCEGDLPGLGTCKHAIAFNISDFCCSDPAADPNTNPPQYTNYCYDSANVFECTVRRQCKGVTRTKPDGSQYTECSQDGSPTTTYRYQKITLTTAGAPRCDATLVTP
jgi:hypothetical protein